MTQYPYPSSVDVSQGLDGLFIYLNTVTGGWFSKLLLIAVYVLFATGFYFARRDMFGALAVSGFAVLVFGTFLWVGGLISGITFTFVVAVSIVGFALLFVDHQ